MDEETEETEKKRRNDPYPNILRAEILRRRACASTAPGEGAEAEVEMLNLTRGVSLHQPDGR